MDKTKTLSLKDKSEIATSWIGVIFVVVGGCIAIGTYVGSIRTQVTDQEKESIAFFRIYNEKDMITLRDDLKPSRRRHYQNLMLEKQPACSKSTRWKNKLRIQWTV